MSDVKRYDVGGDHGYGYCDESIDGEWVHAPDYDVLAQQLVASQKALDHYLPLLNEAIGERDSAQATTTHLEAELSVRDNQLAELIKAFSESLENMISNGKRLVEAEGLLRELSNEPFINPTRLKRMNAYLAAHEGKEHE